MTNILRPHTHFILAPTEQAAIKYMALHRHSFSNPERLWRFCYGNHPTQAQITALLSLTHKKKIILLHENDLLGTITAIKIACWLKKRVVKITYQPTQTISILFNNKLHLFPEHKLSLNRFEKSAGFRSQIKTFRLQTPELD